MAMNAIETVIVIGDIILDEYIDVAIVGNSAEAPIPIFKEIERKLSLGGAANVAINVSNLGYNTILMGVVGALHYDFIAKNLEEKGITTCIFEENRKTTLKRRYIHEGKQIFRSDDEDDYEILEITFHTIINTLKQKISDINISAIILQDYDKGIFHTFLISEINALAQQQGIPVFVDPKRKNFHAYKDIFLFKPNKRELLEGLGLASDVLEDTWIAAAKDFAYMQHIEFLVVTLSDKGVICIHNSEVMQLAGIAIEDADVSGAGDTVIAAAVYTFLRDYTLQERLQIMNKAGAAACKQKGVQGITLLDIEEV
jgi:rfaE bifunctional protein kinase chain/domain